MKYGIVTSPHCFLYCKVGEIDGRNASQVEDEILSGWAVQVLEEAEQGWCKVITHYGYWGYVFEGNLRECTRDFLRQRKEEPEIYQMTAAPETDVLSLPKVQGTMLETLPQNSIVEIICHGEDGWSQVRTASGIEGYVHTVFLKKRQDEDDFLLENAPSEDYFRRKAQEKQSLLSEEEQERLRRAVTDSARRYLGTQYRWGGKSRQGIDCSGLAFMSYMENGLLIYRDARIEEGYPMHPIKKEQLREGDLIFFPGHVAVYLGQDRYIHSTGFSGTPCVTINSLNLHDPDYRADLVNQITACGSLFADSDEEKGSGDKLSTENEKRFQWISERLDKVPGKVSMLYKDLLTEDQFAYRIEESLESASVIKLYLMAAMYQGFEDGEFHPEDRIPVPREACVPSCGVLTYLDDGKTVSLRDLVELMVIVSDNTAANILLDFYGEEKMHRYLKERLGLTKTLFQRKMFDSARAARGLDNYTTVKDTAELLEKIYRGKLVSESASAKMLKTLENQRLNGKIPFYLHAVRPKPVIAHKTGENDGVTHDVAIFEGEHPFLLLFMSNCVDVPEFEKLIGELSLEIYEKHLKGEM